jgi:UDP-N-acetylmuramate dehydrogenase
MFQENVSLSCYSSYKIGGPARYFFEAKNIEEIIKAMDKAHRLKLPIFILGGGTNILFSDEGFNGLILKIQNSKFKIQNDNSKFKIIKAEAGVLLSELVGIATESGLSGLEWAAGIPGTLGGAIRGNAGAFGGEIKDIVDEVVSLDISKSQPRIIRRKNKECQFSYRTSIFKKTKKEIILEAKLIFKKGDKRLIKEVVQKNIDYRFKNQPLYYPSAGSVFKNVPLTQINADYTQINADSQTQLNADYAQINTDNISVNQRTYQYLSTFPIKTDPFPIIPAAYLISEAGLKGVSFGGAMISPKHPNFIVNILGATAHDVKTLILLAKNEVYRKFKIKLEEEIEYL